MTNIVNYFAAGTLAYHLSTNAVGHTNGFAATWDDKKVLENWHYENYTNAEKMARITNAVWTTNFWLHDVQGLSATAIGYSNGVGAQTLLTMISPRHYLRSHHTGTPSQTIVFLATNNAIYIRGYIQQVQVGVTDTDVGILNSDLPASVGFLPVTPPDLLRYLPTGKPVQGIAMDQFMRIFGQPMIFSSEGYVNWQWIATPPFGLTTNWNAAIVGGDSGDPDMLLISNQLVLVSHHVFANEGPNYAAQFDAINRQMHYLSTNNALRTDYQLTPYSLTNWPVINP